MTKDLPSLKDLPNLVVEALKRRPELHLKLSVMEPEAILIYALLNNEPMTADDVVACLMSEPYSLSYSRILDGLNRLLHEGLIRMLGFWDSRTENHRVKIYLTRT